MGVGILRGYDNGTGRIFELIIASKRRLMSNTHMFHDIYNVYRRKSVYPNGDGLISLQLALVI